jgi:hypothetical protein
MAERGIKRIGVIIRFVVAQAETGSHNSTNHCRNNQQVEDWGGVGFKRFQDMIL